MAKVSRRASDAEVRAKLDAVARDMKTVDMRYVNHRIPAVLPEGRVLVHNHIRPRPDLGQDGFRAWTQKPDTDLTLCDCDWAGVELHGLLHYRVVLDR